MIRASKWMAMCALVVTSALVQAQVASSDAPSGGPVSSEQQPPSELLPGVDELPPQPAVAKDSTGMAPTARAGHLSRYHRSHGHHHLAERWRGGHYVRHARFAQSRLVRYHHHRHPGWSRHSLAHRHRHRRHLVLDPYGPYTVPAAFYGPPGPYYGPPYDPF